MIPRKYQRLIFERAKQSNVIAFLETGAGKTLISTLLMDHICQDPLAKVIFLSPTNSLVHQQGDYISNQLDIKVGTYCWESYSISQMKFLWLEEFKSNQCFVMTPQILLNLLQHGYIRMDHISLLVVDECHHSSGNHPVTDIMKYYSNLKNGKPKIFGMTASPLSQGDLSVISVKKRLVELQKILDSTIVTVTNNLDTELCVSKIEERLVRFNSYVVHQGQIYEYLQDVKRELYLFAFASIDVNYRPNIGSMKDMHSQLKELIKNTQHKDTSSLEKQLHSLDTIMLDYGIFASYTSAEQLYKQVLGKSAKRKFDLSYTPLDFSPKLMALIDILKAHFDKPTPQKCIVFVEKRDHAESLCRMIRMISLEHDIKINSSFVVGRGSGRNFPETIIDFREGKINLLVSTNVCAEGIDIPQCDLVVMMDGFRKDANYIQTRGRARDANAKFIILVEKDNKTILKSICRAKIAEQLTYSVLKQPTIATAYASNELDENFANQICGNDETPLIALNGGVLYSNGALAVLTRYMRSIGLSPSINFIEEYPVNNWENVVEQVMKNISDPIERASLHHCPELGYVYSILLPLSTENYIKIYGSLRMTKKAARKHAAFISCKYLISNGLLDNNFFPTNNVVKKEMDSSINYFRVPRFLQPEVNGIKRYFLARFKISEFNLDQSWGILTAGKYQNSSADSIKLWIEGKYPCKIELENIDEIVLSNQEFEDLVANQQKIWNFVLNTRINQSKLNIDNNMEMKAAIEYYIVPLLSVSIDWKKIIELNSLLRSMNDYLAENENKDVNDLVIVTKHAGHLYQNLRLSETYSIESFVKTKGKEKTVVSYQNYFSSFGYTEIRNCRLLEASRATPILNCLEQSEKIKHGKVFLPREACQIIPISLSSLQFLKSIPSLMYSLQSIGNISDFVSIFPCIPTKILLPCFYTIAASPEANYEQLETLGDSVLKFIASLSLIIENKYDMASELSKKRSKLVSNRNLYDKAKAMELNCFLQISNFNPTDWYPPIPCAAPILKVSPREVSLKTTADFLESLCGAYFLHGGFSSAWKFLQKCDIVPPQKPLQIDNSPIDCSLYPFLTLIEKSLGYTFEAPVLLLKSISHSSVSQDNYEVLEYLGDAILDIAVVNYYIKKIPNATPGELSNRRSDAVNNVTLAQWVVKIRIHDHIRCNVGIRYAIEKYIGYLNSEDDFIEFEPPKILADVAEAIVGAIYIDSKCNFELTCSIVFPTFQEFLERPINSNDKASRLFSEHACKNQIMADKITYQ